MRNDATVMASTPSCLNHSPTCADWCVLKCGLSLKLFCLALSTIMRMLRWHFSLSSSRVGTVIFISQVRVKYFVKVLSFRNRCFYSSDPINRALKAFNLTLLRPESTEINITYIKPYCCRIRSNFKLFYKL